jgi:DNA-binding transcriptional ArsR family regulator
MNSLIRERSSQIFTALSHSTRLRIIELLCTGEKTVNEIAADLHLSQSGASQHLAVLTRAGLLAVEQHGVSRVYRIRGPRIQRILDLIAEFCEVHELFGIPEEAEDGE